MCPCMQTTCVKATWPGVTPGVHARLPCAVSEGCMVITAGPQIYAVQAAARPATAEHACARTHWCTAPNVAKVEWRDIGHSVLGGQGPGRPMRQAQATRLPLCWPRLLPLHRHVHTGDFISLFRQNRHCSKPVLERERRERKRGKEGSKDRSFCTHVRTLS